MERDRDYAFYATLDETLILALRFIEEARYASNDFLIGVHLRMASRALRCAMEMYADQRVERLCAQPQQEKAL